MIQSIVSEKKLLEDVIEARLLRDRLKAEKTEAEKAVEIAEAKLAEYMNERGATSTAKYKGLGMAIVDKPQLYARCDAEDRDRLFDYLCGEGRKDLIKPTVHPKTLSTFVGEMLELGKSLPEFVKISMKQTVKIRKV